MATALLAVFRLQAQNLDIQSEAQFITVASLLAQDRLSRVQAGVDFTEGTTSGDFGDDFPGFHFREEISEVSDMKNLFKVRTSIILDMRHQQKEQLFETFVYRR